MLNWYGRFAAREVDADHFAVTRERSANVIGYAFQNPDDTWSIEINGRVLDVLFASFRCAADAILTFDKKRH
jgi:hypothetical protein